MRELEIIVDSHERYAWKFTHQQATTTRRGLPAGDYAVEHGEEIIAAVERKSLQDLVATLTSGKMRYLLADLAQLPRAAVVVEERYSQIFTLERVRPATVADAVAECAARFPQIPILFLDNRSLAQEWTYRFFGAALREASDETGAESRLAQVPSAVAASPAEIRQWARSHGFIVGDRGRVPAEIMAAFERRNA